MATEEDKNGNYPEALRLYQNGVYNFLNSLKNEEGECKCKDSILTLCVSYLERVEEIKRFTHHPPYKTKKKKKKSDFWGFLGLIM